MSIDIVFSIIPRRYNTSQLDNVHMIDDGALLWLSETTPLATIIDGNTGLN